MKIKYTKGTSLEVLQEYLTDFFIKELTMPSIDEICENFGWASKNAAHRKMQMLIDFGVIRKHKGRYTFNPGNFSVKMEEKEDDHRDEFWKKKAESYR